MNLSFFNLQAWNQKDKPNEQARDTDHEQPYIDEGSEFLDDLTREEEQPLRYPEENEAAESR